MFPDERPARIAIAVHAGLTLAVVTIGVWGLRVSRQIKQQQRRITDHLETQTRLLHNAARLAAEHTEEAG